MPVGTDNGEGNTTSGSGGVNGAAGGSHAGALAGGGGVGKGGKSGGYQADDLPLPLMGQGTPFSTRRINRNNEVNQAASYATVREAEYGLPQDEMPFTAGQGFDLLDVDKPVAEPVEGAPGAAGAMIEDRRGTSPMPGRETTKHGNPFDGMGSM